MEIFLLSAVTTFLLASAITSLEAPSVRRTSAAVYYLGAAVGVAILLVLTLVDPDSLEWRHYGGPIARASLLWSLLAIGLGGLTGVLLHGQGWLRIHPLSWHWRPWVRRRWSPFLGIVGVAAVSAFFMSTNQRVTTALLFLLAALAAWMLASALGLREQGRRVPTEAAALYVGGLGGLGLLAYVMVARTTDWLDFGKIAWSYRVSGREMLELVTGTSFGWLVCRWSMLWQQRQSTAGYKWAAGVLLALPLFAAISPHLLSAITSVTGLKTPFAELSFSATRAEHRSAFDVERDKFEANPDWLSGIEGVITRDLAFIVAQEILDGASRDAKQAKLGAEQARDFVPLLKLLFGCVAAADKKLVDHRTLQDALRPVAVKLAEMLEYLAAKATAQPSLAQQEAQGQDKDLTKLKSELVLRLTTAHKLVRENLGTHQDCPEYAPTNNWPAEEAFTSWPVGVLAAQLFAGPHVHNLAAVLFIYTGNLDRAIAVLEPLVNPDAQPPGQFKDHPTLNYLLALSMYYADRDLTDSLAYADRALVVVLNRTETVERAIRKAPQREQELDTLKKWIRTAYPAVANFSAYVSAQAGVRENMATSFAKENYERVIDSSKRRASGVDEEDSAVYTDTYAYVLMAFAARRSPPDMDKIKLAHRLFLEAKSHTRSLPPRGQRAYGILIDAHLRQAERLIGSSR